MNKHLLTFFLLILSFSSFTQGGITCPEMSPICTDVGLNFTANAGGDEASLLDPGNDYDCLFGQPNPTWYYFQIATDGDIQMELAAAQDIDYAIWGPFTSLSVAQAACGSLGDQSPPNPNNGDIVDCSFSTASTENPVITSAITGEVYVMLITNYAGVVQNITLSQTGGTGSTDCNIVTDPPCAISAFNTTISGCDFTTNHYQISGSVEFTDPPSTGDLVFEDCYGNTTVLASAPFNTTSVNYTIANLLANGDACTVQVYFTDENTCSQSVNYVAPACIGNCPSYSLQSSSPTEACGNQMYWMEIENTGCNGFITFDVVGNFGSLWANEISWSVVSNATGNIVAQGGPGSDGAAINATVGPLDPAVEGNLFTLEIVDSFGDGFNGSGGFIEIQQNGVVLTNSITTFTTSSTVIVQPSVNVSSSTLTVTTPSGVVTNVTSNCLDHEIGFMLNNTNFCTPIAVDLPWSIVCDDTGDLIASGTHVVTVFPQVPSSAADLVSVTWNTTSCSWDISPNNDCSALDIGNIFSITPDISTLGPYCANGDETFTVTYNGLSGSPDCCSTAGPVLPIEYTENQTVTNAAVASSPFGGINNSAYFVIPANGSGGNASDLAFDFSMTGYCFDPAGTNTDDSYWVTIYVDGVAIYDVQHFDPPGSMNQSFVLGDMPNGYNENSIVEVYVYPNNFGLLDGSVMTTYVPNGTCPNPGEANWTCASATFSFSATYEQTAPSSINCDFPLVAPYTCCTSSLISATAPAGVNIDCSGDVPAADISAVTNIVSECPAAVAFVSDVSDGNTCPEVITRTYSVTDDCGNSINVTQTITINDITPPTASNPGGIVVECVGDVPAADASVITDASDNCTALPVVAFVSDAPDGNTCPEVIIRTYSVTDDCGNSINVTQTITVNDITPPTASNPAGIDVECVGDVPAADISVVTDAADNCTALPVVAFVSDASDGNTCPEVITRTYSVTDDCGNSINVTQTITVNDITPPTASNPAGIDVECVGDVPAADISVVTDAADNCTVLPVVVFVSDASDGNTCPEVITRTYSVTDDCGNSTNVTQTITINDITTPTASNPPNINIPLAPAPAPDITVITDAADNCTASPIVAFVSDQSDGGDCPEVITRTYSVNDDCGNETLVTQLIIIGGGLVPTPTVTANSPICEGEDAVFTINGLADAVVTFDTGGGSQTLTLLGGAGVVTVPAATSNVTITLSNIADGNCDSDINETLTVEVNPSETPSFNTLGPYCVNGTTDVLPNVSLEGYSGIWTPSSIDVDNSGTTTYTFVPDFAACITDGTMNVIVNEEPFVLAAAIDSSICEGDSVILFIDSLSGGQLVEQFIMTFNEAFSYTTINTNLPGSYYVEVSGTYSGSGACELRDAAYWFYQGCSNVTPIQEYPWKWNGLPPFTQATCPYTYNPNHNYNFFFDGGAAQTFSFSETNAAWYGDNSGGLSFNVYYLGDITWSTGSTNAADTILPPVGQSIYSVSLDYGNGCIATDDLSIEVLPSIVPEFTQIDPVCLNTPEVPFPVISNNGISGIWSTPNLITNIPGLVEVTFFPDPGQCASNATMEILINDLNQPNFDQLGPYCEGDSPGILLGVSNEGITGSWSPNVIDPLLIGTTTYTFTPDPGQCASLMTMDIEITAPTIPTFTQIDDLCEGAEVFPGGSPFPVASIEGIIGVWAPVFDAFNTTTYTFTPDPAFCATTTTMTINIVGFPVVDAGGDQIITCNNNIGGAQIGSSDVPGNAYSWSPTTGLSNPNIANPIANPSMATTYTLTVTNLTGCSSDGTVNVTVDDTPPIVSITNNTGSSTLTCTQLDISVTATGADSYTWDNGLGNNASATITSPGIYTVTGTGLNGCESTQSIEIIQDNNVDLFVVLSDPEICTGEDVLITANSANATGFDWVVLQNSVSGASAGTISNTASGAEIIQTLQLTGVNNGTVEYTITPTLGGCIGASQTVVVDVIAPFIPQFDVLGPFCIDDTPTSLPLVSNSGITGTWNPTTISTATAGTSTYIFTPNPNQCAISQNIDVTVNDLPVVSFSADNLGGCSPLLVNLTSANGSGTWTISNGEVFDGAQVQLNLLNPGCYDVTLEIQQGGCSNALTESDFLCVELNPVADFTATPDVFTDQDVLVSFTNLSSGASSFLWEFGDENTSTYINPSNLYEYTEEGALITLTAISEFGCTDQAQLIIEYEEQEVFYIPNTFTPDGDNFNQMFTPVFYSGFDPFNFEMLIFNRWGEIVFETRNAEIGWDGTYGLNGMKASDGAYTWKITYKNPKTDQRKVIVGHVTLIR